MALSTQQLQRYQQDGYLVVEDLLPPDVLRQMQDHIAELIRQAAEQREKFKTTPEPALEKQNKAPLRKLNDLCFHDDLLRSFAAAPFLTDCVAPLIGDPRQIMLFGDQAFLKPAHCGSAKPLHQDNAYFRVLPHHFGVTCWIALDDATEQNGCMNYVPGSHKLGLLTHKDLGASHLTPDGSVKLAAERPAPVRAGGVIFHHLLALHGSKANTSPHPRRAWALHYVNRDAQCPTKDWGEMIELR